MSQIVKIQINADISDVADITAGTMDQVMSNLEQVRKLVLMIKKTLSDTDVFNESDRQKLKHSLPLLDDAKMLLNKIDMRLGDVASISSGLVSVFERPVEKVDSEPEQAVEVRQEEEKDDIISTR
jgi:hypothetical protein